MTHRSFNLVNIIYGCLHNLITYFDSTIEIRNTRAAFAFKAERDKYRATPSSYKYKPELRKGLDSPNISVASTQLPCRT